MQIKEQRLSGIIIGVLFTIVIILGILLYFNPPSIFPDPANGFHVLRCMELGGKFNILTSPDQEDISKNTSEFLTWWSPGQYLVPYGFKLLFGVNTGQASALTITLCQLLGLSGLYVLFKKIGFSSLIASLSILFIACQQIFIVPYVFYPGGEVLLFAFLGWFLYGCVSLRSTGWKIGLFVLLAGWIGFFCKSSAIWIYGAGLLFMWIRLSFPDKTLATAIKNAAWIGVSALISLGTIYLFFLSKGQNPASVSAGLKLAWQTFSFPLASPLLSGLSIDDLSHGLIFHTGKAIFTTYQVTAIVVVSAILSLWLVITLVRKIRDRNYKMLVAIFYISAIIFFGYAYLHQMTISYEARHFRIIGLLIIPGAIWLISQAKTSYQFLLALIWAGLAISSIFYLVKGYTFNKDISAHGTSGIAQEFIDQPALDKIMMIDKKQRNATFVFVTKDIGLEIRHNRVINLEPIGDDLKIDMDDYEYDGHAGPLYIILPDSYAGPKEKFILKSFPDYKGWYGSMLSSKYVMYEAK
jgi:hypothetical protein